MNCKRLVGDWRTKKHFVSYKQLHRLQGHWIAPVDDIQPNLSFWGIVNIECHPPIQSKSSDAGGVCSEVEEEGYYAR
jgi:hypothetical protein